MATARRRKAGTSRITLSTHGTVFDDAASKKVIHAFLDETKDEASQIGFDFLHARFAKAFKHPKGHYASRVVVDRSLKYGDRAITDQFVVYGGWLEGTSSRNKTTRFKGYRSFRKTRLHLRKIITPLGQKNLDRYVGRLQ